MDTGFGAAAKRKEDPALLRGQGRYIDDIHLPGMLHAAFVRSPFAHAKVGRIDKSAALAIPGVHAVLVFEDDHRWGRWPVRGVGPSGAVD